MIRKRHFFFCLTACALMMMSHSSAQAQSAKSYPKAQGGVITLPSGDISFADRVHRFDEGTPPSKRAAARNPQSILGPTDRPKSASTAILEATTLTLGCHGSITLEFTDNALIDIEGPDLHIWEAGDDVEATFVEISRDGEEWTEIGMVAGATASLDISGHAVNGASYRFVRLTDAKCASRGGNWPGADIDAVAAVGSAERFVFDAGVLFAFDEATLSNEALKILARFADLVGQKEFSRLVIEGHTDSKGSDAYNLELSQRRADAVRAYLATTPRLAQSDMSTRAAGELEPVADNSTDAGRQQNRRVEVIVIP
ncbi:MAG: OmpA family protein [Roseibium sp.]|uniref:OmpA family protein n=1 Tax=Roseibium sp. TaxID=1936156 RepID=UPI001B037B81|nr:OmpA family protein [Roseibium sp.]MBO6894688.1 OmpA family protein [Roseibium sp.]MBO6928609.1 OmpA family protein [Roseibium sp.]